jgi:hypothetical protein
MTPRRALVVTVALPRQRLCRHIHDHRFPDAEGRNHGVVAGAAMWMPDGRVLVLTR